MAEIYRSRAGRDAIEQQYRNALDRWPVANRRFTVPTRHGDTFVIASDKELASPAMPGQLILGGRDELLRSAETRDRMQRAVAQQLTYLENDGHLLPRQTERVAEFLSGAAVRSRCCR